MGERLTTEILCPHCGHAHEVSVALILDISRSVHAVCQACSKPFQWQYELRVDVNTVGLDVQKCPVLKSYDLCYLCAYVRDCPAGRDYVRSLKKEKTAKG